MTIVPSSPFITDVALQRPVTVDHVANPDAHRFVLDEAAFLAELDPSPAFLGDPSPQYLTAAALMPIVEMLASH